MRSVKLDHETPNIRGEHKKKYLSCHHLVYIFNSKTAFCENPIKICLDFNQRMPFDLSGFQFPVQARVSFLYIMRVVGTQELIILIGCMGLVYPGIPTTIKIMGVNITTIVYLRVLIIQIGSTIILMVVEA